MIFKKTRLFSRGMRRVRKKKLDAERLSSRIDAVIRYTQARLNLIRGFSELSAQSGIDDESQQFDMADKKISSYVD